jgi:hypothetical protein
MNTSIIGRPAARALAVFLLAGGATIGLAACQTPPAPAPPAPVQQMRPFDRMLIEQYGGRPVDRVAEDIERAIGNGQLPTPGCISHHVAEHPDGGYHLVCVQDGE